MAQLLETERLILREFTHKDIPLMIQYSKEDTRIKELPDEVFDTVEKATAQVDMCLAHYKNNKYPLPYAIALKETDAMIGHILLSPVKEGIEIGYFISEQHQNKGYATEAIKPFAQWAKIALHWGTVYGEVKQSNIASWKALENAGFVFSHETEQNFFGEKHVFKVYQF